MDHPRFNAGSQKVKLSLKRLQSFCRRFLNSVASDRDISPQQRTGISYSDYASKRIRNRVSER